MTKPSAAKPSLAKAGASNAGTKSTAETKVNTVTPVKPVTTVKPATPVKASTSVKTSTTGADVTKGATKTATKAISGSSMKAINTQKTAVESTPKKAKVAKAEKEKHQKHKMERDSFTMPKSEYAQFSVLKERLNALGQPVKKSELLRAGMMQLTAMTDAALKAALAKVPAIKTGRPKKK